MVDTAGREVICRAACVEHFVTLDVLQPGGPTVMEHKMFIST